MFSSVNQIRESSHTGVSSGFGRSLPWLRRRHGVPREGFPEGETVYRASEQNLSKVEKQKVKKKAMTW